MQVEEYKRDENLNSDLKPEVEKFESHPNETTIEFVDLRKEPKFGVIPYLRKLSIDFVKAVGLKLLFKFARGMDKSRSTVLFDIDKIADLVFSLSNIRYGLFVVLIKLLFKIFRQILYYIKLQDVVEYKRINFVFGLLMNIILVPLGKNMPLVFYTSLFFLLRSIRFFTMKHVYGIQKRVYSESKEIYYLGVSLGFIILSLLNNEYRNNIKLVKYFI